MITLMLIWCEIGLVSLLTGLLIGRYLEIDQIRSDADRWLIAAWTGLGVLPSLLLGVGLLRPLSPEVGQLVMLMVSIIALSHRWVRCQLRQLQATGVLAPKVMISMVLLIVLIVAARLVQPLEHYDTGLYHYGTIDWLASQGAVSGMALVHFRFAFSPAWFALTAIFNHGAFTGRLLTMANGALYLLALLHFSISAARWIRGRSRGADRFIAVAFGVALLIATFFDQLQLSASPNLPVIFLTIVICWMTIVVLDRRSLVDASGDRLIGIQLLPVLVAACLTNIKLNGIAVLIGSLLIYLRTGDRLVSRLRRVAVGGSLVLLTLTPFIVYEAITSGYLIYPVALTNLDLPWSIEVGTARLHAMAIRDWSRWSGPTPRDANGWNWIGQWFSHGAAVKNVVLFNTGAVLVAVGVWSSTRRQAFSVGGFGLVLRYVTRYLPTLIALIFWMKGSLGVKVIGIVPLVSLGLISTLLFVRWGAGRTVAVWSRTSNLSRGLLAIPLDRWMIMTGGLLMTYLLLTRAPAVLIVLVVNGLIVELIRGSIASATAESIASAIAESSAESSAGSTTGWLIILGTLGGLGLMLAAAPGLEYGLGYVATAVGLLIISKPALTGFPVGLLDNRFLAVIIILLVAGPLSIWNRNPIDSVLIPPPLRDTQCRTVRLSNFDIRLPIAGDQCWSCPAPCGPSIEHPGITLRDPSRGISGGFILKLPQ